MCVFLCVQSADDFSERSLRVAEVSRDQRNLEEEEEEEQSPLEANKGEELNQFYFYCTNYAIYCLKTVFM